MGFLDQIGSAASDAVTNIQDAAYSGLQSVFPKGGSAGGGSVTKDTVGFYQVIVHADTRNGAIHLVADGPQEFSFSTSSNYDSPYQSMVEERINQAVNKLPGGGFAGGMIQASGTKFFTQALTAKVWTGASDTIINVPMVFQAETDADADVLSPLMKLMFLSMPREDIEGGLLSSPGPVFDFGGLFSGSTPAGIPNGGPGAAVNAFSKAKSAVTEMIDSGSKILNAGGSVGAGLDAATSAVGKALNKSIVAASDAIKSLVKYPVTLQIGKGFKLENVVIESVTQNHRLQPVGGAYGETTGINARVVVEVTFRSFYTLTQRDIIKMLLPMNEPGSATAAEYRKLIK